MSKVSLVGLEEPETALHPAAAGARQADLAADLDLVLGRLLRRQVGALRQE